MPKPPQYHSATHPPGIDADLAPPAAASQAGIRSTDILSLPTVVCDAIVRAKPVQRADLLSRLLIAVGPLALAVIANGAFSKYLVKARWKELAVSLDDAASATWGQIFDVVQYVAQADPRFVQQVWALLSDNATTLTAAGAAVAAIAINRLAACAASNASRPERGNVDDQSADGPPHRDG